MSVYARSFRAVRDNWLLILLVAVVLEAVPLLLPNLPGQSGSQVALYFLLAHYLHRYFMLGEKAKMLGRAENARPQRIGRFLLVSLALFLPPFIAAAYLVFISYTRASDPGGLGTVVLALVAVISLNLIVLSLFGSALPAAAIGEPAGLRATLRRIRRTVGPTALGLILGPGLFGTVTLVGSSVLLGRLGLLADGAASPVASFLINLLFRLAGLFSTVLTVAVLCTACERTAPSPAWVKAL